MSNGNISILSHIRSVLKRFKIAVIIFHIIQNKRAKLKFQKGCVHTDSGMRHWDKETHESLRYIDETFKTYLEYADIGVNFLKGKRILEIGPGDNFGVALKFIAAGANQVVCIDKFYTRRRIKQQKEIYQSMREQLDVDSKKNFDDAIRLSDDIEINKDRLLYIYSTDRNYGIDEPENILSLGLKSFDLIASSYVLEHVHNLDAAFFVMNSLLKNDGLMVHKIDLSDHGLFSQKGMHPLEFLTVPEFVWRLMTKDSGKVNRKLINYYRNALKKYSYTGKILISKILNEKNELEPYQQNIKCNIDFLEKTLSTIRKRKLKMVFPYNRLDEKDILVSGILFVGKKRGI